MRAYGIGSIARGRSLGPLLGRTFLQEEPSLMAKLKDAWEGLTSGRSSGTYIRPTFPGYEYGRWWHSAAFGQTRFESLGTASTVEEARERLEAVDKAVERRSRELNRRHRR